MNGPPDTSLGTWTLYVRKSRLKSIRSFRPPLRARTIKGARNTVDARKWEKAKRLREEKRASARATSPLLPMPLDRSLNLSRGNHVPDATLIHLRIYIYTYYPFVSLHDALFLFPPNGSLYFYTYIYSTCALSMGEKVAADGPDRWSAQRSFHDTVRTQASGRRSISLRRHLFSFPSFQGHPNRQDSLELWVKRGLIATRAVAMAYKTLCELKTNDFEPSCLPTFNCNMSIPHYRVWKKGSIGSKK